MKAGFRPATSGGDGEDGFFDCLLTYSANRLRELETRISDSLASGGGLLAIAVSASGTGAVNVCFVVSIGRFSEWLAVLHPCAGVAYGAGPIKADGDDCVRMSGPMIGRHKGGVFFEETAFFFAVAGGEFTLGGWIEGSCHIVVLRLGLSESKGDADKGD